MYALLDHLSFLTASHNSLLTLRPRLLINGIRSGADHRDPIPRGGHLTIVCPPDTDFLIQRISRNLDRYRPSLPAHFRGRDSLLLF